MDGWRTLRVMAIVVIALMMVSISIGQLQAQSPTNTPTPYPSFGSGDFFLPPYPSNADRMGFGKTSDNDAGILNAGWYLDWGAAVNPTHPGGAEYGRTIYLNVSNTGTYCSWYKTPATELSQVTPSLTGTVLIDRVQATPGALWMIGNEPDSIYNGSPIQAELYAELYHYFYTTIKAADPTAKVAVGAIVQPSPLRMEYLNKVLTQYQTLYGEPMPVDVWNIHFYRLNEGGCGSWGAGLPPFSDGAGGWNIAFSASELLNVSKLETALRDFRQWMADRGYNSVPLIITEFGVLPPPSYGGFDNNTAAQFLDDMFNMMLSATNPATGLAEDGNRLVQAWAWYSTRDSLHGYGGNLFNSDGSLTVIGNAFVAQTTAHFTPYVTLQLISPTMVTTSPAAIDVFAYTQNMGNSAADTVTVTFALKETGGEPAFTRTVALGQISGRYTEPPVPIDHTWNVTYTQTPTETIPYTVTISILSLTDGISDSIQQEFSVNWWQVRDLTIDLMLADEQKKFSGTPETLVATTTIKNVGHVATTATDATVSVSPLRGSMIFPPQQIPIPTLGPGEIFVFTTAFSVTEIGWYTVTAQFPHPLEKPELTDNNVSSKQYGLILQAYLPLVLK